MSNPPTAPGAEAPAEPPAADTGDRGSILVSSVAFLWGLQFSFFGPTLALLLVALYNATPGQVGTVLMVYNAFGFAAAIVLPAWADRHRSYLKLTVLSGVLTVALVVALALSSSLLVAAIALVVLGSPAGVGVTMMFAHLRHAGASVRDVMNTRAMMSISWVAGPPLASFIIGLWGNRSILWTIAAIGVCTVVTTVVFARQQRGVLDADGHASPVVHADAIALSKLAVVLVVVAFVLLQATNSATMSTMNLFVTHRLGLGIEWGGITLAVAAGLEVPALLAIGRLSARVPMLRLIVSGCVVGVVFYGAMTFVRNPWLLLGLQALNAWFVSVMQGLGLTLFQQIIPRPGLASGLYTNTRRIGNIVAGPMIALAAVSSLGYAVIFPVSVALTVAALAMVLVVTRGARSSG